jgi:hypothetical protein
LGDDWATRNAFMITGGATSIRQFERNRAAWPGRRRALCCVRPQPSVGIPSGKICETSQWLCGFRQKTDPLCRTGAEAASSFDRPDPVPLNVPSPINALSGKEMPRLDVAAKVDGSANFAGDIRLPDMLYASVRAGPTGDTTLKSIAASKGSVSGGGRCRKDRRLGCGAGDQLVGRQQGARCNCTGLSRPSVSWPKASTMNEQWSKSAFPKGPGARYCDHRVGRCSI